MAQLPVLALVGRPNVGKSTLFNRLTRSRAALVADVPGLTRDRQYGRGRSGERSFITIDSGGFEPIAKTGIAVEMARQTRHRVLDTAVAGGGIVSGFHLPSPAIGRVTRRGSGFDFTPLS